MVRPDTEYAPVKALLGLRNLDIYSQKKLTVGSSR
jgi:hypothetical protein